MNGSRSVIGGGAGVVVFVGLVVLRTNHLMFL